MVFTDNIHLMADTVPELHAFAQKVGLKRYRFKGPTRHPHYDLPNSHMGDMTIKAGAKLMSAKEMIIRLRGW